MMPAWRDEADLGMPLTCLLGPGISTLPEAVFNRKHEE